jgi:hypothetical protein
VSCRTAIKHGYTERLRADYQGAFDEWALQVSSLQAIASSASDGFVMKEAEARVAAAEIAYRDTRDRLIDDLVVVSGRTDTCD